MCAIVSDASGEGFGPRAHSAPFQATIRTLPCRRFKINPPMVDLATSVQIVAEHTVATTQRPAKVETAWSSQNTSPRAAQCTRAAEKVAVMTTIHFSRHILMRLMG